MKKFLYIFSAVILFCVILFLSIRIAAPYIITFGLGKAINGTAEIARLDLGYDNKLIRINISGIGLKGDIEGVINDVRISVDLSKWITLNNFVISDFDISMKKTKDGKIRYIPVPAEQIVIEKGVVKYDTSRFIINEVRINHLKRKQPFTFSLNIDNNYYFRSIKAQGQGVYNKRNFQIKGDADISELDIGRWSDNIKGRVNSKNSFQYQNNKLNLQGQIKINDFLLRAYFFSKPLALKQVGGKLSLNYANQNTDIQISNVLFKGSPFDVSLRFEKSELVAVNLSSGFIDINDIKNYLSLDSISKGTGNIMKFIKDGSARLNRLLYDEKKPFLCDIDLKGIGIRYEDMDLRNIDGNLSFDNQKVVLKNFRGVFKSSSLNNINGQFNFDKDRNFKIKGGYLLNLVDIPSKLDIGDLKFKNGSTEGSFAIEGKHGKDYTLSGAGKLNSSEVMYGKLSVTATGSYKFKKDEITFDPLVINKHGTSIRIRGKWKKDFIGLRIKGDLNIIHIDQFVKIPFNVRGLANLDIEIEKKGNDFRLFGDILMDELYYEIPYYIKKEKGVPSRANLSMLMNKESINVQRLVLDIDGVNMKLTCLVEKNVAKDMHIRLEVPKLENVGHLFFFKDGIAKGSIWIDAKIKDLAFPFKRLPYISGTVKIVNGYLRIPWLASPLSEIKLVSDFKGDTFSLTGTEIRCGKSLFNLIEINSKGLESPNFTISVDMENFDYDDFETPGDFKIYSIGSENIMARATGDISIKTKNMRINNIRGNNILLRAVYGERRLNISEFKANAIGGDVDAHGAIDLSKSVPNINLTSRMREISGGQFLKMFGAKTHIIESKEFIFLDLGFYGTDKKEFLSSLSGRASFYSEDGVIKKMNLLSKIFGLLNVYDLLRGRVDLLTSGFKYRKTGANFVINNGVFRTNDYIIDSPAMVITGQGSLDIVKEVVDAKVTVSPLVTLDRIVSSIPILNNILNEKKRGFIYAVYDVKGPLEDPEIKTSYIQTIGSLPLNILRGMIEFPKGLFGIDKAKDAR